MEKTGGMLHWPGLLRWSLENSDGTGPTATADKERLQFLRDYMEHLNSNSVSLEELLIEAAQELKQPNVSEETELAALKVIEDCVDNKPDLCRHLHKYGALEPLISKSLSKSCEVALKSLETLAYCLSNNPEVQSEAVKLHLFEILYESIDKSVDSVGSAECPEDLFRLRVAALSGLVCHNRIAEMKLVAQDPSKEDGARWLAKLLNVSDLRIQLKVAGLVGHCISQELITAEQVTDSGLPEILVTLVRDAPSTDVPGSLQYTEAITALHDTVVEFVKPKLMSDSVNKACTNISLDLSSN